MEDRRDTLGRGGFIPTIPSPPESTVDHDSRLPSPRQKPLRVATPKYEAFLDHVEQRMLNISRRFEKRVNGDTSIAEVEQDAGFRSYAELAGELHKVIDLVWISGTPALQTVFLLNIALTASSCLSAFAFCARATFDLLNTLDLALCSLLRGENVETGARLPGFEGSRGRLSTTEKVRLKSIIEKTRAGVLIATVGKQQASDPEVTPQDHEASDMEAARVYERSLEELGVSLPELG